MVSDQELRRRKDDEWHIGKTVDVGHILTTVILIIGGMLYVGDIDKRLTVLESNVKVTDEMRQDIKDIKDLVVPLPEFMSRKNGTDKEQWERIRELERQ